MQLSELVGRRVGVLGLGVEGRSVVRALRRAGHQAEIAAIDDKPGAEEPGLRWQRDAEGVEVLVRSPGVKPTHPVLTAWKGPLTTATNLFLAEVGPFTIGITGSKGKSTTSTLAWMALREAGVNAVLVGNIGRPALDELEAVRQGSIAVLEMSSYQCNDLVEGPGTAVLLGLFPEHMDWHGSLEAYYAAKRKILIGAGRVVRQGIEVNTPSTLHFSDGWFQRGGRRLFADQGMLLRGRHNRENACVALTAVEPLGVAVAHMQAVVQRFGGLPYRLQDRGFIHGLRWINDAISTAPEAAAAALQAIGPEVATLIVGGQDRGYDWAPLQAALAAQPVENLICLPDSGRKLEGHQVADLAEAVALARRLTPAGRTVLFSPGSPSYNQFKNFEDRGATLDALCEAG